MGPFEIVRKKRIIASAYEIFILNKLLGKKFPFFVSWALTYRCNRNCFYCGANDVKNEDLNTEIVLSFIDEMSKMGTRIISFTGGEPFLREDIDIIVNYCKTKGIYVNINTNGSLLSGKAEKIKWIDRIVFSLDGPRDIHDAVRGKGSYNEVMEAVKLAKSKLWNIKFTSVLTDANLDYIESILDMAQGLKTVVVFQPARQLKRGSGKPNQLLSQKGKYQKAIKKLIGYKLNKYPFLGNSLLCLSHYLKWPNPTVVPCAASRIYCRIENDGMIKGCGSEANIETLNGKKLGFKNAFMLLNPSNCLQCWIAAQVEFNFIYSFKLDAIKNSLLFL